MALITITDPMEIKDPRDKTKMNIWQLVPTEKWDPNQYQIKLNGKILKDVLYDYVEHDEGEYKGYTYWHTICHAKTGEVHIEVEDKPPRAMEACLNDLAISLAGVDKPNQIFHNN